MSMDWALKDKVALVTGATRGIGREVAEQLAAGGAKIVVNARALEQVEQRAAELAERHGIETLGVAADAGDAKAVSALYQAIFKRFKRLDVLVNCAGVMRDALLAMSSEELVRETLQVNLAGAIYHVQGAAKLMARGRSGSIIQLASIVGEQGLEGLSVYAASKAGVVGLVRAAAKELAAQGVRVNAVAPGFIKTDMTAHYSDERVASTVQNIRIGRAGTATDVAGTILYLASDLSSYVTGQVIGVDGSMRT
jgi:3-oxoacyl-[acyl-carrier protein] reductase